MLVTLPDRPWPVDSGKRRRASATFSALLVSGAELDVLVVAAGGPPEDFLPPGCTVRRATLIDPGLRRRPRAMLASALRRVPWQVGVVRWGIVRRVLRAWSRRPYDLVWFGSLDHALSLGRYVRGARVVIDLDDVETAKGRAFLDLGPAASSGGRVKRFQRRVELPLWQRAQDLALRTADAVLVCSELDRERLGGGARVHVVPNGYAAGQERVLQPDGATATVLMVGTFTYAPNADAAVFAATEVLPALRRSVPAARLRIVGHGADLLPRDVRDAAGVDVVGPVEEMAPELRRAAVSLAPIRFGGGTRVKILEAFAYSVPVVTTPLGCEGLDARDGEHLLVREDAAALADACAELLMDPEAARRIGAAGHQHLLGHFQPEHVERALLDALSSALTVAR